MFKKNYQVMLLKEIDKPFNDKKYLYELKFDGIRALIYASKNKLVIKSRNNIDITARFPEFQEIKKLVKNKNVIFDGEIIALNEDGNPDFSKVQGRNNLKNKDKIIEESLNNPAYFMVFDILYEDKELINLPLIKRKEILNKYQDTTHFLKSHTFSDGLKLFKVVKEKKLEGIIAKLKNSLYEPGYRVDSWLKIKNFQNKEYIIHAYNFLKEKYSLLLGEYRQEKLYYVGKVSITKNRPELKKILKTPKSPNQFINCQDKATYIKPINKIKVSYIEITKNGTLRQPFIK